MCPVILSDTERVHQMRKPIEPEGQHLRGMAHRVVGRSHRLRVVLDRWHLQDEQDPVDLLLSGAQSDERRIELSQPFFQARRGVACRISRHEDEPDRIARLGRELPEHGRDVGDMHWADVGAMGVAEEEERDLAGGCQPEVERYAVLVDEREIGLLAGGSGDDSAEARVGARRRALAV